jgi:hypothetical protein
MIYDTIISLAWLQNTAQYCTLLLQNRSESSLFYQADVSACHILTLIYWTRLITTYTTLRCQKTLWERLKGVAPHFQAWRDSLLLTHEIGSTKVLMQTVEKRPSHIVGNNATITYDTRMICDMIMLWYDIWYYMVWYDVIMIWYMIWYDMIW